MHEPSTYIVFVLFFSGGGRAGVSLLVPISIIPSDINGYGNGASERTEPLWLEEEEEAEWGQS